MKELILNFANQIAQSCEIANKTPLSPYNKEIKNVVISGLGGSGIGGTIVSNLVKDIASVPIIISKDYSIPHFVDEHTLFIASSYSGNTEETYEALQSAFNKNAKIVCVTSGGEIENFAKINNLDYRIIPGGNPPRACLGYSFTQLIQILVSYNIIPAAFKQDLQDSIELLNSQETNIQTMALVLAQSLHNKRIIIYSESSLEGACIRLRQQLNENSKMLCWHHVIPEMNHNELVGWTEENHNLAVLFIKNDKNDYAKNRIRMEISKEVISKYTPNIFDIHTQGETLMQNTLYFIHLGDWISYYLSELNGVDIMDIAVIDYLKSTLAKS